MRFAFFGDVVGRSGRDGLSEHLPGLKRVLDLEFVIINAENAASGFGITENTAKELFAAGADCLTLGNHSWDQKEALTYIVREPRLIRPLNYPILSDAPGRGTQLFETDRGRRIMVTNLLGIDASLAPSWVSYGALFGAFTGMLVLIYAVVASASNAIQFALAGAVSSLLISLLLSGVVSFYLIAAAIFGALVGTGQYFGARLIEKGNID